MSLRHFPSCLRGRRRARSCEGLSCSSPDLVSCTSSDFATSEEWGGVTCLKRMDEVMERKIRTEAMKKRRSVTNEK